MILFRLRYRSVTATAYRDSMSANVTHRYLTVPSVTDRPSPLITVPHRNGKVFYNELGKLELGVLRQCRCLASHYFCSSLTACRNQLSFSFNIRLAVKPETQWRPGNIGKPKTVIGTQKNLGLDFLNPNPTQKLKIFVFQNFLNALFNG